MPRLAKEIGVIPVPPKYTSADFLKSTYWKLRGKLDVPKERWICYPGAERAVGAAAVPFDLLPVITGMAAKPSNCILVTTPSAFPT